MSNKTTGEHPMTRHLTRETDGKLILQLRDISHTMRHLYEGNGSQQSILIRLLDAGEITQREFTQQLGIQPGSASEVLAKLEGAGLITRTASETDRRTADIQLTQEGIRRARAELARRRTRHKEMFSVLSDTEKTELLALLEKVNQDWDSRYRAKPDKRNGEQNDGGNGLPLTPASAESHITPNKIRRGRHAKKGQVE